MPEFAVNGKMYISVFVIIIIFYELTNFIFSSISNAAYGFKEFIHTKHNLHVVNFEFILIPFNTFILV